MAAGAFADITSFKSSFANSGSWLKGLAASGTFGGKLFGVPYYAGSRVVTYRKDAYSKAGITKLPTSLAEFTAVAKRLAAKNASTKGFSPGYIAGTDRYFAMSFVYDYRRLVPRTSGGQWVGQHPQRDDPARIERQRAGGGTQLVRAGSEALGRCREREYPPQHARADPHRQADRQAGRCVRERQHHVGAERVLAAERQDSRRNGSCRRDHAQVVSAAAPHPGPRPPPVRPVLADPPGR